MTEETKVITFAEKWHAEKLLKRSKKKARKQLQNQGHSHGEARAIVKKAVNQIAAKPERKSAGRGR
jgi:uncharacterized membrane protein